MFNYWKCPICQATCKSSSKEGRELLICEDDFHSYSFRSTGGLKGQEVINGLVVDTPGVPAFRRGVITALRYEYLKSTQLVFCFYKDAYVSREIHKNCDCGPKSATEDTRNRLKDLEKESQKYLKNLEEK